MVSQLVNPMSWIRRNFLWLGLVTIAGGGFILGSIYLNLLSSPNSTPDDDNGTIIYEAVPDSPGDYDENFFIPTPVNDFLAEAGEDLDSEYTVSGDTVERKELDYIMTKKYDQRGVLLSEEYVDDDGILLVKVEGTFRVIPSGNIELILGFMALAVVAIVFVMIQKKKLLIRNS